MTAEEIRAGIIDRVHHIAAEHRYEITEKSPGEFFSGQAHASVGVKDGALYVVVDGTDIQDTLGAEPAEAGAQRIIRALTTPRAQES